VTSVSGVLSGAKGRLLPPSIPFRFFAAAALFHVALWVAMVRDADQVMSFRGGGGPPLAALHLLVLGVLTTTAVGAAVQLLPVATRRTLAAFWLVKLVFWLLVPGLVLLISGIYTGRINLLIGGAAASTAGLVLFAGLLGDNLRRADSLPVIAAYGWAALVALLGVAVLGLALSADFARGFLPNHLAVARAHMILGAFGFMGLLVLGFSHVLIPMFALSPAPDKRPALAGFATAVTAVACGALGALIDSRDVMTLAACLGLVAAGIHLWLMRRSLQAGMRKRLGLSFILVRAAWVSLPLTLGVGLATIHERTGPNGPALFGLLLLGGWLLTFLLGVLQRILPFLASMHVAPQQPGGSLSLTQLGTSAPLKVHAVCHGTALLGLAVAILLNAGSVARVASTIGLIGAVAFAVFTVDVLRRLGKGHKHRVLAAGDG
jgi:hypothetical protein